MTEFNPQFITRGGMKQYVVLPYNEYVELLEKIEDLEDLVDLREARQANAGKPRVTQEEMERRCGIAPTEP